MPEVVSFGSYGLRNQFGIQSGSNVFDSVATAANDFAQALAQSLPIGNWPTVFKPLQRIYTAAEVEKLRLDALREQESHYGRPIPRLWGKMRLAGNIIWTTDDFYVMFSILPTSSSFGDYPIFPQPLPGEELPEGTYWATDVAVLVCAGPIDRVQCIWADDVVIYADAALISNGSATVGTGVSYLNLAIYKGTESQGPDPTMEGHLGSGNVPAYRGSCYVVITGLDLTRFGNRLPSFTFHVRERPGGSAPISDVLEDVATEAGLEATDYDFSGATGFT